MSEITRVFVTIAGSTVALKRSVMLAKSMLSGLANYGKAIALPAMAGFGGGAFILSRSLSTAVKEASDLGESISKTQQVLGRSSAEAEAFARNMATAGKNTVSGVLDGMTATIMALRNQGVGREMAESIARQLEQRKIDASSFFNVDPRQIAQDLQSAFAGNAETLRKYFVYLNADQIKAGGLSAAEAISRAFLRGTQAAEGDFDRTRNSIANLQRATSILASTAFSSVGESFYGFGQAMEVLKQTIWRFVISLGESGALQSLGEALQESVLLMIAFGEAVAEMVASTGVAGSTLKAIGEAIRGFFIGMIIVIKKPFDLLALAVIEANIQLINLAQWLASWIGQGQILGGMKGELEAAKSVIANDIQQIIDGIDAQVAAKVAELKTNVSSPVNPLGAPAMPKPGTTSGGSVAYSSALVGAFSRENLQLQETQKQTKLLEKIAAGKPEQQGVGQVVSKPRPGVTSGLMGA